MSAVVISGNTSGSITLDAPAIAGTTVLTLAPVSGIIAPLVSGTAVASTSGTSIDFTGIPSWVKRITVIFSSVSTNGTSVPLIRLGDSGGIETTGYDAGACFGTAAVSHYFASTAGFPVSTTSQVATIALSGSVVFTNISGNIWVGHGSMFFGATAVVTAACAGTKTLSDVLNQIRITTVNGTDTFDAGSINIMYE